MIYRGFKEMAYRRELKKDCKHCKFFKITEDEGDDCVSGYCCASERESEIKGTWKHVQPTVRKTNAIGCRWFEDGYAEDFRPFLKELREKNQENKG